MMQLQINRWLLTLLLGSGLSSYGQITNTGDVSIAPQTTVGVLSPITNTITGQFANDGQLYLAQNWVNEGGFTYTNTAHSGQVHLQGTTAQSLSGSGFTEVPHLVVNTVQGVQLSGDISVQAGLLFTQGIVNTRDYPGQLWLEDGAVVNGASDTGYVNGTVFKKGQGAVVLPTGGNAQYHGLGLRQISDAELSFSGVYVNENSNAVHAHEQKQSNIGLIASSGYWRLTKLQGNGMAVVGLHYNTYTLPADLTANIDRLKVVRYDVASQQWVSEGGVVDAVNQMVYSTQAIGQFGVFALAEGIDDTDTDGDGVPDYVEENGNPSTNPNDPKDFIDTDGDGVPDYVEENGNPVTNPNDPNDFTDTDGDGVPDYVEENGNPATNPNDANDFTDTDGDGVPDYVEENGNPVTNPNDANDFIDTDGDGVPDYVEENGNPATDPNDSNDFTDTNGDGVPDYTQRDNNQGDLQIVHEAVSKGNPESFFQIGNITDFPDNTFKLFNRYGKEVFSINRYDNASNRFSGFSNSGNLLKEGSELADGVYFYIIHYTKEGQKRKRSGYLYITQ